MGNINCVGIDEALAISGGCCTLRDKVNYVVGKKTVWNWLFITDVKRISLEVMTISPIKCENIKTLDGIQATVTSRAECKVCEERPFLEKFYQELMGKPREHIENAVKQLFESTLRIEIGEYNFDTIHDDRCEFAQLINNRVIVESMKLGIDIVSFTITDVQRTSIASPQSVELQQPM